MKKIIYLLVVFSFLSPVVSWAEEASESEGWPSAFQQTVLTPSQPEENQSGDMPSQEQMGKPGMMNMMNMMDMMKGKMCPMMGKASMVATAEGGVFVLMGDKLQKYDADLNLIKEVKITPPMMEKEEPQPANDSTVAAMEETMPAEEASSETI